MINNNIKRVLCIMSNMNAGGAETFLMKIYYGLDKTKYQMDFCVTANENVYAEKILFMGGIIYTIPAKSKNPIQSFYDIKKIVKDNNYKYVLRINEHSLSVIDLLAARIGGAQKLIMRSSNSASGTRISTFLHILFRFLPKRIPDIKLAPSILAAEYTFGKKSVAKGNVIIMKNGLDVTKYSFSQIARNNIRKEFGINSEFIVGHVGRFNLQKNHTFILETFYQFLHIRPDAKLVLVGEGVLFETIIEKAKEMGIIDSCIFTGVRSDVNHILSAMDVFIFPSFYEGMPNTVIEAQTAGLPCVISDSITEEADITGLVQYVSLNESAENWAEKISKIRNVNRQKVSEQIKKSGYDINDVVRQFENIIFY